MQLGFNSSDRDYNLLRAPHEMLVDSTLNVYKEVRTKQMLHHLKYQKISIKWRTEEP
uniref:Uncharacterized protein n=1 Tax=Nelumbo nucifera TaxID=4432 RepID=A0A822XGN2_NELNU|nr:TPA_asm: hypothetical protein HUJ06_020555 [Nelumbo nucifera]